MSPRRSIPPSARAAASSGGGCLSGYLLPPLAVILVGILMACLLLGASPTSSPATPGATLAGALSPVFTPEVGSWAGWILLWSAEAGVDPDLAATVMQIESCGDPQARSSAGAMGLFQVMPFHFGYDENPYDPATNARNGLSYLRRALDASAGDPRLALAGYNGGIGVIGRSESTWAAETQRYAYWGSGIYAEAASGAGESARLQEWLEAGGASLCSGAHQRLGLP